MTLRPYQQAAIDALYAHLQAKDNNPLIVLPTGSGKSPLMAAICRDAVELWNGRVLILAHVKELLEQTADKLNTICPDVMVGIYSAGLGLRDTLAPVIVAGIQSAYTKAGELGRFDLVMVDECHLLKTDGEGMYCTLIAALKEINPALRVIGLTATPFRLDSGHIAAPDHIINEICYEAGVLDLIVQGYLCPLVSKASRAETDFTGVHVRAGEFIADEVNNLLGTDAAVAAACREMIQECAERHSVIVFAQGVEHGKKILEVLKQTQKADAVFGDTLDFEREKTLQDFKDGHIKFLVNVGVLTTGFDAPNIDCVALLRPTMSPGLYYQMVGRGFRKSPTKTNCMVLDFGGNIERHGPIDLIQPGRAGSEKPPAKMCPSCRAYCAIAYSVCPNCGRPFPVPEQGSPRRGPTHDTTATTRGITSGQESFTKYDVISVSYYLHRKMKKVDGESVPDETKPPSLKVEYEVGFNKYKSEWICLQHRGFALDKAIEWWVKHSDEMVPTTIEQAVEMCRAGACRTPRSITVKSVAGEPFDRITEYEFGEPEPVTIPADDPPMHQAASANPLHQKSFFVTLEDGSVSECVSGADIQTQIVDLDTYDLKQLMIHEAGNDATGWKSASWWGFKPGLCQIQSPEMASPTEPAPLNDDDIPF